MKLFEISLKVLDEEFPDQEKKKTNKKKESALFPIKNRHQVLGEKKMFKEREQKDKLSKRI